MSESVPERHCPDCGLELPQPGACPHCVLRLALGEDPGPAGQVALHRPPTGLHSRFFGDYEILDEIARGGMGVVYRARHLNLKRVVALKLIHASHLLSPEARMRFGLEVATVAQLNHPHIVTLYESGEFKGTHFFTMRLVEGGNLAQHIKAARPGGDVAGPLCASPPLHSAGTIVDLVGKTARALHYAHQRGILHRDIKPSNILIDLQGEPHIVDFGLAKMLGRESAATFTDSVLGSPNYMAPEQAVGRSSELTVATDVYGLGAVLYEALTGVPPFQAGTPVETIRKVLDEDPVPPRRLKPAIDSDLETICLKCLEKKPSARYGTAEELAADLERWRKGLPIMARPIGPLGAAWRWSRRRPVVVTLGLALIVALAAITAGTILAAMRVREAERIAVGHWRDALIEQARAVSLSGEVGMRTEALRLIQQAVALGGPPEFRLRARDQMLATLALTDVSFAPLMPVDVEPTLALLDPAMERLALVRDQTNLVISRVPDRTVVLDVSVGLSPVTRVDAFSPDGRYLALRHRDGLSFWDTREGRQCFATNGPRRQYCFAAEAPLVVLEDWNYGASIRELPTFREARRLTAAPDPPGKRPAGWQALSLSPDGTLLAGARVHENLLELLEVGSGLARWRATNVALVTAMAWSSSRQLLATAGADRSIRAWKEATGASRVIYRMTAAARNLAIDESGSILAAVSEDGIVRLVDLASQRRLSYTKCDGHHLSFDPEGRRLGTFFRSNEVGWLDLERSSEFREFIVGSSASGVTRCEFSPDGLTIASGMPGSIELRDAGSGRSVARLRVERLPIVAFDPRGTDVFTSDSKGIRKWTRGPGETGVLAAASAIIHPGRGWRALTFSADGGRFVAANTTSNAAYVFDRTLTNRLATLEPHVGVEALAVSPDGRLVATGSPRTRDVCVWEVESGLPIANFPADPESRIEFSGDGRWLLTDGDSVELRDTRTWAPAPALPFPGDVLSHGGATISGDSRVLAVVIDDFEVQLFDLAAWTPIARLRPPSFTRLNALAFSRDGTRLAAACAHGRLRVWSLDVIRRQLGELGLDWELPPLSDRR